MVETLSEFPFRKLRNYKYTILDVLMHLEIKDAFTFLFSANKETREYLERNFITITNGFTNEGLVNFEFYGGSNYDAYEQLEKLYF
jgi:hypothetical protein